jgi:uncharacterized RDD family membrane protein YckC
MSRLFAWLIDGTLLTLHVAALSWLAGRDRWLDLLLADLRPWCALAACLAIAWSWFFVSLGGSTPGMMLLGQRIETLRGDPLTPPEALTRALWAVPSFALGLFGFALALFDARGQTLHDKLCGCVVVTGPPPLR